MNTESIASDVVRERVLSHLWLVRVLARRYASSGVGQEDLVAEGTLGLLVAAERFEERGKPFATYASLWIRTYLRAYVNRHRDMPGGEAEEEVLEKLHSDRPLPDQLTDARRWRNKLDLAIRQLWPDLDARERAILTERLLADDGPTLEELSRRFGVTGERLRQLEHALLAKLRGVLAPELAATPKRKGKKAGPIGRAAERLHRLRYTSDTSPRLVA